VTGAPSSHADGGAEGADHRPLKTPAPPSGAGDFPRIADYGFLSDCHSGALVAPDGSIEWLCLPRFDSASVFGALLDRGAGHFRLAPGSERVPVATRYEPGTMILETTWATDTGWIVVRDAVTIGPWHEETSEPHARPPSDHEADHLLLRLVRCVQGEVEIEMECEPAFDYGRERPGWELPDRHNTETGFGDLRLRLTTDMNVGIEGPVAVARHRLADGDQAYCALSWSEVLDPPVSAEEAQERLEHTADFWRRWLADGDFPDHPWRIHLQRSALTLKGLMYAPTGAAIAAATTSLPETPGGERNWDYRFTWIRDATFTLWSLHVLGFDEEARDFARFIGDIARRGADLQIMYGIGGERELTESTLDHLSGYGGAQPVRVGNAAHAQRQNDVWGALLDSLYIHVKAGNRIPNRGWEWVAAQVEAAAAAWEAPDQGIWEARGEPKHYVSSKLMCWVALERGARLARQRGDDRAERWASLADAIRVDICSKGVSARGVFRQHYGTDALDASTLLIPLVRFLPPTDERVRNTVLAISEELTESGLVLRYRVDETDDGMEGREGTFTICSFWLVSALSEIGERDRARALCERLLSFAGRLNLYAEEIDPHSGAHLGNFPQAFTHLALINAVAHVIADEMRPPNGGEQTAVFSELRNA
jgi:GH15 family glucan-1,4-alpha-glucosidase